MLSVAKLVNNNTVNNLYREHHKQTVEVKVAL